MLVGEVRCATTGFGSSWKLSGGSMLSAGVTKVSKKRQVRRAIRRRSRVSGSDIARRRATAGRRLDHSASAGARATAVRTAARAARTHGRVQRSRRPTAPAREPCRPPSAGRSRAGRGADAPCDCAAVVHSSRCRRVTNRRISVRTIASPMRHAWSARNATERAGLQRGQAEIGSERCADDCADECRRDAAGSRTDVGRKAGIAIAASTKSAPARPAAIGSSQHNASAAT